MWAVTSSSINTSDIIIILWKPRSWPFISSHTCAISVGTENARSSSRRWAWITESHSSGFSEVEHFLRRHFQCLKLWHRTSHARDAQENVLAFFIPSHASPLTLLSSLGFYPTQRLMRWPVTLSWVLQKTGDFWVKDREPCRGSASSTDVVFALIPLASSRAMEVMWYGPWWVLYAQLIASQCRAVNLGYHCFIRSSKQACSLYWRKTWSRPSKIITWTGLWEAAG